MKIAYIINGLWNSAGMERVFTVRANFLCNYFDITFITKGQGDRPDYFKLDKRIHRFDISDNIPYKDGLQKILLANRYDITVATGGIESHYLYKIKDGSKKIYEFHFSYDMSKIWKKGIKNPIRRFLAIQYQKFGRIYVASHYDKVVVLNKADCNKWRRWLPKTIYIYNPSTITCEQATTCENKRAIAVGRLNIQKGFDYLIDVWERVHQKFPDWQLDIFGEGALRSELQAKIQEKGLANIINIKGVTNDIVKEYQKHSIYLMSSRSEGFPLVLIEASACGLPIVSFDCPSGPSEIVEHGGNGFLISPVGNIDAMANRVMQLIADKSLRQEMGRRSLELSQRFKLENIAAEWIELYNQLVSS